MCIVRVREEEEEEEEEEAGRGSRKRTKVPRLVRPLLQAPVQLVEEGLLERGVPALGLRQRRGVEGVLLALLRRAQGARELPAGEGDGFAVNHGHSGRRQWGVLNRFGMTGGVWSGCFMYIASRRPFDVHADRSMRNKIK